MKIFGPFTDKTKLITLLCLLLSAGFLATSLVSYYVSREALRDSIKITELPLTSDNVYSEIQKDLVRPILISSMMARDTFLRDWVIGGERDPQKISQYLKEVMTHYGAVTSFYVSESTRTYYTNHGLLKTVRGDESRDAWYYRVREMSEPYEINVDPDLANRDQLTIFINYRVFDFNKRFIGATGVGLTVDTVNRLIDDYQLRYGRTIFLVDAQGKITLSGKNSDNGKIVDSSIHRIDGLRDQAEAILKAGSGSFQYQSQGHEYFLNVRYIPELKWHLFVIKQEDKTLESIQHTLYLNLLLCLVITLIVLSVVHLTVNHYQRRLETMATTDNLTGLANRHALDILLEQQTREAARHGNSMSAIMLDIDHFKALNDRHGHLLGDDVLRSIATLLKENLRSADVACRWGGEEFLIILSGTGLTAATKVAKELCERIEKSRPEFNGQPIPVTASAGVTTYRKGESCESLIARADALLYQAKAEGRNRVCSEVGASEPAAPE
jgi:diguanylate cyclase (GGDEF)-like protein